MVMMVVLEAEPVRLTEQQAVSESSCTPSIVVPNGLDLWRVGYERMQDHQYKAAAQAYYQLFLCSNRGWTPINPLVRDYDQTQPFGAAVDAAARGKFLAAIAGLQNVLKILPQFGEARFLMGVFQWSAGMHSQARATWSKTITAPYFTQPPDFDETPRGVTEAAKYLWWASRRD